MCVCDASYTYCTCDVVWIACACGVAALSVVQVKQVAMLIMIDRCYVIAGIN